MKTIELIDKYEIHQSDNDYNPPSYIWSDNTGELIRCKDCKYFKRGIECDNERFGRGWGYYPLPSVSEDFYCADAERKEE